MYLKSDILPLADVFESFKKMCLKIYELDPAKFLSAPGLAWKAAFKNAEVKVVEKVVRGEICNTISRYAKTNNTYITLL